MSQQQNSHRPDGLPRVAVVVPTYNQEAFLKEAIESAWNQTLKPDEVVVVDNASTDGTQALCESLGDRIRYVRMAENRGAGAARNAGAAATECPIIVYLDGDDVLREDCLAARVPILAADPEAGLVLGTMMIVSPDLSPLFEDPLWLKGRSEISFDEAVLHLSCPTGGLVVRKSKLDEIGGWDETLWNSQDSDLLIRMAAHAKCLIDPEPRSLYRQVPGSLSKNPMRVVRYFKQMLDKNRAVAPDPDRYDRIARKAWRIKAAHFVFGSIWDDDKGQKLSRMAAAICEMPELIHSFRIWVVHAVASKFRRLFRR